MKNLLLVLSCSLTLGLQAQINPSDGCTGVPALTVNASCVNNNYTLSGTYANGGLVTSGTCTAGLNRDDGWYSFTATSTTTTVTATGNQDRAVVIWSACGGGVELGCDYQLSGTAASVTVPTTIGTTYYIQLHRRSGTNTANMTGTICAFQGPTSGPCIPNTVIASIPYSQTGLNTAGAGDDFSSADACGSSYMDGDDYTFTYTPAVNECVSISLSNTSTWVGLFVTNGCPSAGGVTCVASNTNSAGNPAVSGVNLTAGVTYFFTVSTWPSPQTTPFDISVIACPPPPANDNCGGAIPAPVNPDLLCGLTTVSSTNNSTNSGISACAGSGADDDVWFSFVATSTVHNFDILSISGTSTDVVHEIFSGSCPGGLTSIGCSDPNSSQFSGFTIGQTYYVRVYTYGTGSFANFTLCIGTPPPPPSNDEPCGATILAVNSGSCFYQAATLPTSATISTGMPAPGCSSLGPDIWFQVTVPAGGLIIDLSNNGGPTDMGMAWYTGPNCNNLNTLIECDDDDSQNGAMPMICHAGSSCTIPGDCQQNSTLTPGTTVWVRVWEYGGGTFGGFDICAYSPAPAGGASTCANATVIPALPFTNSGTTCCAANTYSSATGCLSSYQDGEDYMYTYTPAANQTIDINITGSLAYTGVFVTNACPSAGGVACIGSATSTTGNPSLCGVNLVAGTTYYIMIDTDPTPNCTPFNISINTSTAPTCNLNYSYSTIPFAPDLNAGVNIALPIDDRFSSSYLPIGFDFCFDGFQYNQALLSSNGYLIFDPISCASNLPGGNASPGAYSGWPINAAIPNTTDAPRNCIMFPWQDVDPSLGGTIRYQVLGTAPNRRFVITFDQVPYFSCTSLLFTGQLKLFETTNNIEIHLTNKTVCTTWNGGAGILGLHNFNGTQAVLGTNYPTQWSVTNTAYRFTYNCPGPCIVISPLPVELASFDGQSMEDYNLLTWETYSETDNEQFVVEHSPNGIDFEVLGYVQGNGTSTELNHYDFRHEDPTMLEYYRLRQVDMNGVSEYSNTIALSRRKDVGIHFYPNPSNNQLFVGLDRELEGDYVVRYTDMLGKTYQQSIYMTKNVLSYELEHFRQLPKGIYMIQLIGNDEVISIDKIVKE